MKRNFKTRIIAFVVLGWVMAAGNSNAQNQNPEDSISSKIDLEQVVISASRYEQDPNKVGRSITIIGNKQIENSLNSYVGELLAEQEGIHLVGTGQNFGSNQRAFLRGTNSYHNVVMIDGVRINDPSSVDNGIDISEMSLANVERIEIIRGGHSTIYGSSAIGGVINIITKKNAAKKLNLSLDSKYGMFGENSSSLNNNMFFNYSAIGGLYFNASISQSLVQGINATVDTITNPATYNNPDKDNFEKLDACGKIGFRNKKWDVFLSYKNVNQTLDLDKSAYKDDDNRKTQFERSLINYGLFYDVNSKIKLGFSGGFSEMQRKDIDDSSKVDALGTYDHVFNKSVFDGSYFNNELTARYKSDKITGLVGLSLVEEKMNNFNYVYSNDPFFGLYESTTDLDSLNLKAQTQSAFLHIDLKGNLLSENLKMLTLTLGGRISNHSKFGNNFTYEFNPSYQLNENTLLYASFSTGYNAPSLYHLYEPYKAFGAYTSRGNDKLKPETSITYDFGVKHRLNDKVDFSISYFYTVVNDIIEYVYLWDKNIGIDTLGNDWMRADYKGDTYINLSQQKMNGIEFSINSKLHEKLSIQGNFSFITATSTYKADDIDTSYTGGNHVQLFQSGDFLTKDEAETIDLIRRPNSVINLFVYYKPIKK
ncbi:MAG: TonB-dependent receptor, partial [Saprospiraceae bacterium]|nr:TonB-dependent receptor [Saprospiraceae bacterium]